MSAQPVNHLSRATIAAGVVVACLLLTSLFMIFFVAPTESTMGDVQRIVYLHVSVAWCGLVAMIAMGCCGAMYLVRRRLEWDFWSQAAAEVGYLCTTLTLITGSAWAHEAWGTWWTWEPRLTSSLVLWIMYSGILLVRSSIEDPHRRGRIGAVLAIIGVADVPLVLMATRWFRGVHPIAPEMDPRMHIVLLVAVVSFTVLFAYLAVLRRRQLEISDRTAELESSVSYRNAARWLIHRRPS
jgi:heme exporter protein C